MKRALREAFWDFWKLSQSAYTQLQHPNATIKKLAEEWYRMELEYRTSQGILKTQNDAE